MNLGRLLFPDKGAKLRNTNHVYGVAVYTGVDTKIFLNQQQVPSKFSTVEQKLNKMIVIVFLVQALLIAASCINNVIARHTSKKNPFEGMARFGCVYINRKRNELKRIHCGHSKLDKSFDFVPENYSNFPLGNYGSCKGSPSQIYGVG